MQSTSLSAFPWLTLLMVLALIAAAAVWFIKSARPAARQVGIVVSVIIFALFIVAGVTGFDPAQAGTVQLQEIYPWIPQIGVSIAWGVNGMGLVMIGLATFLVPVVLIAAGSELKEESTSRAAGYMAWVLVLEAIMIGIFAARDVFLFYVLFELMLVPMFFLIGNYGGKKRRRAAIKFLVYSLVGGLVMLAGVVGLFAMGPGGEQAFLVQNLQQFISKNTSIQLPLFLSFFFAFAVKAPMFPVHTWLPDTTEQARPGTSTLLVGVLDKIGTYGMIAFCLPLFPVAAKDCAMPIMVLAVISILWGGFKAIASKDLMRLIAYTSVSHFGFMVLAIFSGSSVAMTGAILYMVAHGVGTGALFLFVGFLGERGGNYRVLGYGGWQRVTPLLAGSFLVAGLASIALPGLSGFIPEYLILVGTYSAYPALAICAVFGVILAALYILVPYQRIFTGPKPKVEVEDLHGREKVVAGVLIAAMLYLGFAPAATLDVIRPVGEASTFVSLEKAANNAADAGSTPASTTEGSAK